MRHIHWLVSGAAALCSIAAAAGGCAESSAPDNPGSTSSGGSGTLSSNGGAGGGVGTGGDGGSEVCVVATAKAEAVTLALLMLIDRSESMFYEGKWQATQGALGEFFEAPSSEGISAGLLFFPSLTKPAQKCEVEPYKHLDVPIAPLPGNAFALTNAIPAEPTKDGGTPTLHAMIGALQVATAHQDANPTHRVNVVLTTDGDPGHCPGYGNTAIPAEVAETVNKVAEEAASALNYNGVRTYVIGVPGATVSYLNTIANAGGTDKAYDVTEAIGEFTETLDEIREASLGCDFALPEPPGGVEVIPNEVNFTYTPGGTSVSITLPRAENLTDCGDAPGWYYDDNVAPQKMILCPASCATVQNDKQAAVTAAFGCTSVLN